MRFLLPILLATCGPAAAQCELAHLVPDPFTPGGQAGRSVAIQGDTAFVGAPGMIVGRGAVLVYERSGGQWAQIALLQASTSTTPAAFGDALAVDGDVLVVGAPTEGSAAPQGGTVYFFERSGGAWSETGFITGNTPQGGLGRYLDVSGGTVLVGDPHHASAGAFSGVGRIYEKVGGAWTRTHDLLPTQLAGGDAVGTGVALDGDRAILSAPGDDTVGPDLGAIHVFEYQSAAWSQTAKVTGALGEDLYIRVDLDGDRFAVLGLFRPPSPLAGRDGVVLYDLIGGVWERTATLLPSDRPQSTLFGNSIDLDGDRVAVGAPWHGFPTRVGAAYLYRRLGTQWAQVARFRPGAQSGEPQIAFSVALDGDTILAGSPGVDTPPILDAGGAFLFELDSAFLPFCRCEQGPVCSNDDPLAGCANTRGAGALLTGCASASVASDDLVITVTGMPINVHGFVFMGTSRDMRFPLGDGLRCVGAGPGGLIPFAVRKSGASGSFSSGPGLVAAAPAGTISAGSTWYFQAWYRDRPGICGRGSNLSNALAVTFEP